MGRCHMHWVFAILLGCTVHVRAQAPPEQHTVDRLAAWLGGPARAELERVLGTPLPRVPQLHLAPASYLRKVPDADIVNHIRWQFPHLQGQALTNALIDALTMDQQGKHARMVEGSSVVLVLPDNHLAVDKDSPLARAATHDFLQLSVLHEVVRMALDARYHLPRLRRSCRDAEEWFAMQAIVEGRALMLTRAAAKGLQLEDCVPLLTQQYASAPDVSPDPALRATSHSAMEQKAWAMTYGSAFWNTLAEKSRMEEKAVFARPPRQHKWILEPQRYVRALESNQPDLVALLGRLESLLPAAEWAPYPQAWTPAMVVQVAGMLGDKTRAAKVVDAWDDGRSLVWAKKSDSGCMVGVSAVRFESAAAARAYFGFAVDLQRKRDELSNSDCGLPLRVVESRPKTVTFPGVDEISYADKKMQPTAGGAVIPATFLLARAGEHVYEITWHGLAADVAWAQRVLRELTRP